ncbi:MAG: rRNA synthase [Solirubrobacterales bacterium]|jgi:23S rRNA pseudouridine2605 synthase|nr:rRNA synthase [Solirubrobacterales bacterium]MDX6652560.1 rRNA synthase [Solirubrobacterales bacterium]MDX6663129.1 rRNA synthase [Solirubrobacterales bacterium]
MRLAKYLAHAGAASRRGAEELVAAGRVEVDGRRVTDPARDVSDDNIVSLDGRPLASEPHEVWVLNKPLGVVSTAKEPGQRQAVVDLVDSRVRLYPVGRLDVDSTGLILLTNDGELANRLTHPRYEVPKTYAVALKRPPSDLDLDKLRRGVTLEDGLTRPARVRRVSERQIEVTIAEGRNRQVRRMVEAIGNAVDSLRRTRLGPLQLGELAPGASRRLSDAEVERLWKDARR